MMRSTNRTGGAARSSRSPPLINNTSQLAAVFLLEATEFASAATRGGGAWITHMCGMPRPEVWEVFGGHAEISLQVSGAGCLATQPFDILDILGGATSVKADSERRPSVSRSRAVRG